MFQQFDFRENDPYTWYLDARTRIDSQPNELQHKLGLEFITYPTGEAGLRILKPNGAIVKNLIVLFQDNAASRLYELALLRDAIRWTCEPEQYLTLRLPYVPCTRSDRQMTPGEGCGILTYSKILNSLNFDRVEVLDLHSNVSKLLINGVQEYTQENVLSMASLPPYGGLAYHKYVWVAPDAGAAKKIFTLARNLEFKGPIVTAYKDRDPSTGVIDHSKTKLDTASLQASVSSVLSDGKFLIIDDICSKGGTFKGIAAALKVIGAREIVLVTSHNEGTMNQAEMLAAGIDRCISTDSMAAPYFLQEGNLSYPYLTRIPVYGYYK
jgi:ribose-phosphate pyrophosphokinase